MTCAMSPAPNMFVADMLRFLDCQALTLGQQGYQALAAPGSSVSLLLAALITIYIALIGYRMLFGNAPDVREGVLAFVKIGIVLAFASSWPAYRTVVFDVVLRTPADLAAEIGRPAGLPGAAGGLAGRMDGVDRSFRLLAIYGAGTPTREEVARLDGVAPPVFANFDGFALGASRLIFLVGGVGAFALTRFAAALLLALGPLFIAFLLFDATRGLAGGWLKGLIAATLGATAAAVAMGIQLSLFEPWLTDLVARRAGGVAIPGTPTAVLAATLVLMLATFGLLAVATRIAFAFAPSAVINHRWNAQNEHLPATTGEGAMARGSAGSPQQSRAMAIVDSIAAIQRREERASALLVSSPASLRGSGPPGIQSVYVSRGSSGRRTARRSSVSGRMRDTRG